MLLEELLFVFENNKNLSENFVVSRNSVTPFPSGGFMVELMWIRACCWGCVVIDGFATKIGR